MQEEMTQVIRRRLESIMLLLLQVAANREMAVVQPQPYLKQGWEGRADNELSSGD